MRINSRFLYTLVLQAVYLAAGYFGLFVGVAPAWNVFRCIFWYCAIIGILAFLVPRSATDKMRKRGRSIPKWLSKAFDILILLALAWTGHFWMFGFQLLQMISEESVFSPDEETAE